MNWKKSYKTFCSVFQYLAVQRGNKHGGQEYNDLCKIGFRWCHMKTLYCSYVDKYYNSSSCRIQLKTIKSYTTANLYPISLNLIRQLQWCWVVVNWFNCHIHSKKYTKYAIKSSDVSPHVKVSPTVDEDAVIWFLSFKNRLSFCSFELLCVEHIVCVSIKTSRSCLLYFKFKMASGWT